MIKKKKGLKAFVQQIFEGEGYALARLQYVFCSDEYLLKINQSHLDHDYFTDIITFDLSDTLCEIIGEIYISTDRVKENSIIHETSYLNELSRVIFHGALHLCGFKDKTKREITIMRRKEEEYLRLFEKTLR
ncbi:MAG: rRNA maturation RNase YbeY [Flavitalea sp.]